MNVQIDKSDNTLKDGYVELSVVFHQGTVKFGFYPGDPEFDARVYEGYKGAAEIIKNDEKGDDLDKEENPFIIISERGKKIKTIFNDIFGYDISAELFKYASPYLIYGEEKNLALHYFNKIISAIDAAMEEYNASFEKAKKKHVAKYEDKK